MVLQFTFSVELHSQYFMSNANALNATSMNDTDIALGEYSINSNGLNGKFNIISIDSQGFFNGTMALYPFDKPTSNVTGKYDKESNEIIFGSVTEYPQFSKNESYKAYRFTNVIADCIAGSGPGSCSQYTTFAGTFNRTGDNQTFGWYAIHKPEECLACPS
jgi:hypothetical protein